MSEQSTFWSGEHLASLSASPDCAADFSMTVATWPSNLLVASPECTHHSIARGGRPMNDQSRASAWHIVRWAEAIYIDNILIENVREFRDWGPIGADARPLKSKKGETYRAFLTALRSLGYTVEDRVLNAADYGDATTRERLFVIARRGGKKIVWPEATHSKTGATSLFGKTRKWRAAREIVDWSIPGKDIFERKRPLSPTTMKRIMAGLKKFGGKELEPFLVVLRNHGDARSLDLPMPTLTAGGEHFGVCEPFVLGQQSGSVARSVDKPLPTIACGGAIAMVEPFLLNIDHTGGNGNQVRSVDAPVPTVTTKERTAVVEPFIVGAGGPAYSAKPKSINEPMGTVLTSNHKALVEPFLIPAGGPKVAPRSVDQPLNTVLCRDHMALVEPFIVPFFGEREGQQPRTHSIDEPLPTVTGHGAAAIVEPYIVTVNHGDKGESVAHRCKSIDDPLGTVTTHNGYGVAEAFVTKYNRTGTAKSVDEPLDTVTTKDRFALIVPEVNGYRLVVKFRMLQPHELARAQSFDGYKFTGRRADIVKQIGNAVPVRLARALCTAILADYKPKKTETERTALWLRQRSRSRSGRNADWQTRCEST
jgi:DNA (cytosine-5)-methyltransferase 1